MRAAKSLFPSAPRSSACAACIEVCTACRRLDGARLLEAAHAGSGTFGRASGGALPSAPRVEARGARRGRRARRHAAIRLKCHCVHLAPGQIVASATPTPHSPTHTPPPSLPRTIALSASPTQGIPTGLQLTVLWRAPPIHAPSPSIASSRSIAHLLSPPTHAPPRHAPLSSTGVRSSSRPRAVPTPRQLPCKPSRATRRQARPLGRALCARNLRMHLQLETRRRWPAPA